MKNKVTLVWDYHGGGRLVGIFDDDGAIQRLRGLVAESGQRNYVRFAEVTVNEVASTSFSSHPKAARSSLGQGRLMAELDREAVIRTWAARRRVLERFQYLGIVIFLVAVFGVDFLLPGSLAEHGVAVRIVLVLALVALYVAVLVTYCRCPKCDQHPGPKGPRIDAPAHVRQSRRFDMENWEACYKCGADLR